eukprot:TRINITY_DN8260_c0_g2_i1.p1 TRINITY_DN8260_c0_g2~~TRINITY_DN8260_c0_g2_i1.p1  ORF type:complete len:210 (+),score=94.83 TRINITY_DN8260_c0_g2_i1:77-631(+)
MAQQGVDAEAKAVLDFWFGLSMKQQFATDPELDKEIEAKFGAVLERARAGELASWRATPQGRLAEIIVLDQFTRNLCRGSPAAFSHDPMALALAQEAVRVGALDEMEGPQKAFLVMPYMHSESKAVHVEALKLFALPGLEGNLAFEEKHKAVIDRFGRYPSRNAVLGRQSTPEEEEFLKEGQGW